MFQPDLRTALEANVVINLDNELEVSLVDSLLKELPSAERSIGLRVNPVVGAGSIGMMSTASKVSKFGLPVTDQTKARVLDLYKQNSWLNGIHIHVGSQGVPLDLFVKGARVSWDMFSGTEPSRLELLTKYIRC